MSPVLWEGVTLHPRGIPSPKAPAQSTLLSLATASLEQGAGCPARPGAAGAGWKEASCPGFEGCSEFLLCGAGEHTGKAALVCALALGCVHHHGTAE